MSVLITKCKCGRAMGNCRILDGKPGRRTEASRASCPSCAPSKYTVGYYRRKTGNLLFKELHGLKGC